MDQTINFVRGLTKLRPGYEWVEGGWKKRPVPEEVLSDMQLKQVRWGLGLGWAGLWWRRVQVGRCGVRQ